MLNCTSANVGNTCSVQSNGCYRVSGCDVSKKYYDTNSACILANTNKSCARDERSGCYKVTGCDNSQGYYDTREEVTSQFPGYNIIESNGCFARGTAKTCPDGEYTSCAPKTGNTVVKNETGNYAGPSACGTCVYTCNTRSVIIKTTRPVPPTITAKPALLTKPPTVTKRQAATPLSVITAPLPSAKTRSKAITALRTTAAIPKEPPKTARSANT